LKGFIRIFVMIGIGAILYQICGDDIAVRKAFLITGMFCGIYYYFDQFFK